MHNPTRSVAAAFVLLLLAGCATEVVRTGSGTKTDTAVVIAPSRLRTWLDPTETWSPTILSVDGVKTKAATARVEVAPGHHTLTSYCGTDSSSPQQLEFEAVAGATYELMFREPLKNLR